MTPAVVPDLSGMKQTQFPPMVTEPGTTTRRMVAGTSTLGFGLLIERGSGFLANILAARFGGAATFGAYSLAIGTANNVATYAGAGIGSTAARFSGKYQYGTPGYTVLARVLIIVSIVSAIASSVGLWLGAGPIAHLLGQERLVGLLRWTAISAGGIVLLECARGFFVGQRRLRALILMSSLVGAGMLSFVPLAAFHRNPVRMITSQGLVTTGAVLTCLLLARRLGLTSPSRTARMTCFGAVLREVWTFGMVQLAGLVGANAAGWWLMTLIVRADGTFVQIGFFGIASQLRNIVGLAPGLLTEGSIAVMADPEGELSRTPHRVLALTSFASSTVSFFMASIGILIAPWMLRVLYTNAYSNAVVTVAVSLALAVLHMGNAPASARLSIVSIRASAVINIIWAITVVIGGTLLMSRSGGATKAMTIYLAAHALSSILVIVMLARKDSLPEGVGATYALATLSVILLAGLAAMRCLHPEHFFLLTGLMSLFAVATFSTLLALGHHYRWVPTRAAIQRLAAYLKGPIQRLIRRRPYAI